MKSSTGCDHTDLDILSEFPIPLPFRFVYFRSFLYETPCKKLKMGYVQDSPDNFKCMYDTQCESCGKYI